MIETVTVIEIGTVLATVIETGKVPENRLGIDSALLRRQHHCLRSTFGLDAVHPVHFSRPLHLAVSNLSYWPNFLDK